MERIKLNLDSIAMMLFCARLKAYKEVPLSNEEWLLIERIIKKKGLKGPASLLSMNQTELEEILNMPSTGAKADAVMALESLGYTRSEAVKAVSAVYSEEKSAEALIKAALRKMI